MSDADWSNAIKEFAPSVDPAELMAHPLNARMHPDSQRSALRGSLGRVGWVDAVKVNVRTGRIVDGHARVEEALALGANVPVLYVDLSEEDERYVLATLDPISALAVYDNDVLADLVDSISLEEGPVEDMLNDLLGQYAGPPPPPNLDDLDDDHDPEVFWPVIKVKVHPEVYTTWEALVGEYGGDEATALKALLDR